MTEQTEQGTEAAARQADIRLQAALNRHAGWQLEYDIMLIRADRKRLLSQIAELASTCERLNAAYAAEAARANDRDRLAARVTELELTPRCGAMTPSAFINAEPLGPCVLDHGHGGMHQEGSCGIPPIPGARWTEHTDPTAEGA